MATVYVYNQGTNTIERYIRALTDPMPYVAGQTLTVKEFRGSSCSQVLWTTKATMEAWNTTRNVWGRPIDVGYAFKRIWEGGHGQQSQHYAGVSFDVAQRMNKYNRDALRTLASDLGVWSYVEPANLTPTWVHFDKRYGPPACAVGYPQLVQTSRGVYVFVLQDALAALGFTGAGLDGIFGNNTLNAVVRFQRSRGIPTTGVVACQTWTALTGDALGIGGTGTTLAPCT